MTTPAAVPVMLLLVFLSLIGFGVVIPLLPFFASAFKAEAWQVALLFSVFSLGQFGGELTWGRLSDRVGRRPVLLITIVASAIGYVALAYAPSIWIALLVRTFAGFASGNMGVIQGYMVDVSPPERLAGRLGLVGSAFGVGFVVGPALGGLMAQPELGAAGFRPPLIMAAGLCMVATLGIVAFVRESRTFGAVPATRANPFEALIDALKHVVLSKAFAVIFVGFLASSSLWSVLGLWAEARFGWGPRQVGLMMAGTGVAAAMTQGLLAGMMTRRFGSGPTIVAGFGFGSLCLIAMAQSPWGWLGAVLLTASVVGNALWQPATSAIVSAAADISRQGAVLGAASAAGSLARVAGPVVGGVLFSVLGPWAPLTFAGLMMLPAAWLGWRAAQALRFAAASDG